MTTKTITKKMIIDALKKDLVVLEKQKKATEDYIKIGCGQFLNVGNDQWCGGKKEVIRLYKDMIKFANSAIRKLESLKKEPSDIWDVLDNLWYCEGKASEADVFYGGNEKEYHHSVLPNLLKLMGR